MRVAVVTGGVTGIGRAVVERFAGAGDLVYVLDVDEEGEKLEGDGCRFIRCDITVQQDVDAAVQQVGETSDRLDVLVNNAGGFPDRRSLEEETLDEWDRTLRLNLTSVFLVSKAFMPLIRRSEQPRIVNIGSLAGQAVGWQTSPAYGAAKAAVHALTRMMAAELAPDGITVNALAPSAVLTERIRKLRSEQELEATAATVPLGRYQTPEEVAAWVDFLASDEAGFTTGQTVSVNGGRFMA